ncbi:MAG TPA: hypothetical protein VIJ22_15325 [Polyangiaceae bacterium]
MAVVDPHRLAELRSLAYHRAVAERLADPRFLESARARVREWLERGHLPLYAAEWQRLLEGPVEELRAALEADTEASRALRQATPFAGAIDARERWRIWARVREEVQALP